MDSSSMNKNHEKKDIPVYQCLKNKAAAKSGGKQVCELVFNFKGTIGTCKWCKKRVQT